MILTVCPSPCIDVNIEVDSLSVGMSHNVISKRTFMTGKALNVAIGLSRLGAQTFTTGFMYEENGNLFEQELHREGISYQFVWNKGRVRENYKFIDRKSMLTEVNDVSEPVGKDKQNELLNLVEKLSKSCESVVLSGSLARGMSPDYYQKVLSRVPAGVVKVVDSEGERLFSALKCGVDLVKPNKEELERTLKTSLNSKADMLSACGKILDMGAKIVMLSLGKRGAIITDGVKSYHSKSINVAMNSTIGAGDGMVAAATYALVRGGGLKDVLKCGVAAGTAAVTSSDSISFRKDKYEEILSGLSVEEI